MGAGEDTNNVGSSLLQDPQNLFKGPKASLEIFSSHLQIQFGLFPSIFFEKFKKGFFRH
jgi:hypothetical protein